MSDSFYAPSDSRLFSHSINTKVPGDRWVLLFPSLRWGLLGSNLLKATELVRCRARTWEQIDLSLKNYFVPGKCISKGKKEAGAIPFELPVCFRWTWLLHLNYRDRFNFPLGCKISSLWFLCSLLMKLQSLQRFKTCVLFDENKPKASA